jgi:hypothetical protein
MARFPSATDVKSRPWTTIRPPAGRTPTQDEFGGLSAAKHAQDNGVVRTGEEPKKGADFEWCHLIADSLGGPTEQANLACATYHANTAMLCIERELKGKTYLDVRVEMDVRRGTHIAEKITYQIRKTPSHSKKRQKVGETKIFTETIDGLASGCTKDEGEKLRGRVKELVSKHKSK